VAVLTLQPRTSHFVSDSDAPNMAVGVVVGGGGDGVSAISVDMAVGVVAGGGIDGASAIVIL
jgi:hypothetical protein